MQGPSRPGSTVPPGEPEYCLTGCVLVCIDNISRNLKEGPDAGYQNLVNLGRQIQKAFLFRLPDGFYEDIATLVLVDSAFDQNFFQPALSPTEETAGNLARQFERNRTSAASVKCPKITCEEYVGSLLMRQYGTREGELRHRKNIAVWREKTRKWNRGMQQLAGCRESCEESCR